MESKQRWPAVLEEFTQRNAGRRVRLEVNEPEWGAQWQEPDYPLLGVAYDPRDDRVEIMLGQQGSTEKHLTHSITEVTSLDVVEGNGNGGVLRIAHGDAQTLVRLS